MKQLKLAALLFCLLSLNAFAEPDGKSKNSVMDFEAEVIDGEKKVPELFLQLDSDRSDVSTILYDRPNFNDFTPIHSYLRPTLSDPNRAAVGVKK